MALGALQPQEQIVNPYSPSPVTTHPPAPRAKGKWVVGRQGASSKAITQKAITSSLGAVSSAYPVTMETDHWWGGAGLQRNED